MRVRELAEWLGAAFEGDGELEINDVGALESAGAHDLSFVTSAVAVARAAGSRAGCLIVPLDFPNVDGRTLIRVPTARTAFARAVLRLRPSPPRDPGIHPSAVIGANVKLAADVAIGPGAVIGDGTRVGAGVSIAAGCVIGRDVEIGAGSLIHAHVTIYDRVVIGLNAILHSGCVLGADGFGFTMEGGAYQKFPQVGAVQIGDFVEIGANSCVDRAALGVTLIGEGTKLDNMVHVGHNCRIGRHVVVAAQTGFSGGVVVEDYAVIGGQVGIGDKARIESRAVLGSGCGVLTSKVIRAGEVVWGTPARPLKQHLAQLAHLARLPGLRKELADLKRRLLRLEGA